MEVYVENRFEVESAMENVFEVTADNWVQQVLASKLLTVVDFWHNNCYWCLQLNPIRDEVSKEYAGRIQFVELNVLGSSSNRALAQRYGVMGTPTLIFFCKGRPVNSTVGFMPKERLKKTLDDMLRKYTDCFAQSTELHSESM